MKLGQRPGSSRGAGYCHWFRSHRPQRRCVIGAVGQKSGRCIAAPGDNNQGKKPNQPVAASEGQRRPEHVRQAPGDGRPSLRWTNRSPSRRKARNDKGCHKVFIFYAQACAQNLWISLSVSARAPPGFRAAPRADVVVTAIRLQSLTPSRLRRCAHSFAGCAMRNDSSLAALYAEDSNANPSDTVGAVLLPVIVSCRSRFKGRRVAVGTACGRWPSSTLETCAAPCLRVPGNPALNTGAHHEQHHRRTEL